MQEDRGRQHRQVRVVGGGLVEVAGRPGEQQPVQGRPRTLGERGLVRLRKLGLHRLHEASGQRLAAERLRPAAGRIAQLAGKEADHRIGDVVGLRVRLEVGRVGVAADQGQREIAHHLGRRRHLDDVAENPVRRGVHVLDRLEAVAQAERDRLLAQVRQLSAGDLVVVDPSGRPGQARLEGRVQLAHGLEVRLQGIDGRERETRVTRGVLQRGDQGRHRHLRGGACHGRGGDVHRVHSGVDRREQGAQLAAGGVVGVQVDGQVEVLAQGCDQLGGRRRPQQPGHVLDGQDVRTRLDQFLGPAQVVVEGVEGLVRAGHVARVADRRLGHRVVGLQHRLDRRTDLVDVVEGVEDAEDVEPGVRRLVHEGVGDLQRVWGVADRVASAQQHLQRDVGHRLVQRVEPRPRVFLQEAQRDVVGGAAPGLGREEVGQQPRNRRGNRHQVAGADAGGQQ